MAGIVEPQAGKAVFSGEAIEFNRLGSGHVGAEAAQKNHSRAAPRMRHIGQTLSVGTL